jgi:enoyl-CoA hydratase
LQYSQDGHIAEIILNRPQKMNMISLKWGITLSKIVDEVVANQEVRVILIWSEGKLFTAGLDLSEFTSIAGDQTKESTAAASARFLRTVTAFQEPFIKLHRSLKPVIVAVHGKCIGGGVDLITACDIRLCTVDATFSVKETQIGMVADLGTIPRLIRIVGKGVYSEMVFTGEPLSAERALSFGLVNSIYPNKETLLQGARELCRKIADNSPLAVQGAKKVLLYAEDHTFDDTLDYVGVWNAAFINSEDLKEAVMSFIQKRKPSFKNKL